MTPDEMVQAACALVMPLLSGSGARDASRRRPIFVSIDGGAGAGKSTLARSVNRLFGAACVRTDHFFRPLSEYPAAALSPERAYELYFPWRRMRDQALMSLSRGRPARFQCHDWITNRLAKWIHVDPRPVILIEGVYSSRPELHSMLDLKIFVEAPREERRTRVLARGPIPPELGDWLTPWMRAEDWYFERIRPQDAADLVLHASG